MAQQQNHSQNKRFWDFVSKTGQPPELILYGDIASTSWWGDEVTPRQFSDELNALGDVPEIVVRINSGGGDVFAANAIYTRLKDHAASITVKIDGWAGSAATIIAMAGDVIQIPAAAAFMVHDPKMGVLGYYSEQELTKLAQETRTIKNCIVNAYALKTGKDKAEIEQIMSASTWYTGAEAVENGFCDELMFEDVDAHVENAGKIIVNAVEMDLSRLVNIPAAWLDKAKPTPPRMGAENQKESETEMEIKTVDELRAAFPELVKQAEDTATAAERKRIQDIEGVAIAGYEDIIQAAKFKQPVAAAEVAMQIVSRQKQQGEAYLNDRSADVQNSGMDGVGADSRESTIDRGMNLFDAAIDKLYPENGREG